MFRPLTVIFLCWILSPFLSAQIGSLYDIGDLKTAVQAPRNHVTLLCRFNGQYLVIQATIAPNWHLYSITQPPGATIRSTIELEPPDLKLQKIQPTAAPKVDSHNVFGVDLEEHERTVTWILTFQERLPSGTAIRGKFDGMVCQTGEGGVCVPLRSILFEAAFDESLDVKPLLKQAESVAKRFVLRLGDSPDAAEGNKQNPTADVGTPPVPPTPVPTPETVFEVQEYVYVTNFWRALLYAFLGGIILNFMPCVLPVIGLKILSFFDQAGKNRTRALMLNIWYALGLITVILFLAFLSLGLSILFTFDLFGIIMACIVFVMALSLMDIWTLQAPGIFGGKTSVQLTKQEGFLGAYFKGIITTLLAIPCGAPLLSPAVAWADMQIRSGNMPGVFLMYSVIGLGMASPYLLLGAFPEWLRFLPKPGAWMETFKKTMGFCLLLAVVWILYFIPVEKILPAIVLLFALWFVCWLFGHKQFTGKTKKRNYIIAPVVVGLALVFSFQIPYIPNPYTLESAMRTKIFGNQGEHWQPYSGESLSSALSSGKMVVVDFTADWCVNCKVLEAGVLQSDAVLALLDKKQIVSLTADCTREGEARNLLLQLGPELVPTLAVFDPANPHKPRVIRGFYTRKMLTEQLR